MLFSVENCASTLAFNALAFTLAFNALAFYTSHLNNIVKRHSSPFISIGVLFSVVSQKEKVDRPLWLPTKLLQSANKFSYCPWKTIKLPGADDTGITEIVCPYVEFVGMPLPTKSECK